MHQRAFYAVVLAACLAGSNGVLIKHMTSLTPGAIAFIRAIVPSAILVLWLTKERPNLLRGNTRKMVGGSVINAGRMYLYLIAFTYTSIGNAVIIFYSWPIFAAIFSVIFLKERISTKQSLLIALAFFGLLLAYSNKSFSFEDKDFVGMLAAIGSAIGYAITVIIFKSESDNYHRNETIFFQNITGAIVFLPFFWINWPVADINHIGFGVGYAFLIGIVVASLFFFGLKYLKASTASSLMYLEVVSSVLFGFLVINEQLSTEMILGGVLIIASSFLLNRVK